MATDIRPQLLEAFDEFGWQMSPPPDLAERVRERARTHRRRVTAMVATIAVVLSGLVVVIAETRLGQKPHQKAEPAPRIRISGGNVDSMAIHGNTLYVARSEYPHGSVTAYDRATGLPTAVAKLPARPSSVVVGADATVWVTFSPSNAGRLAGVAELSADLRQQTRLLTDDRYLDAATSDVSPIGNGRALVATDRGLITVSLPPLGGRLTVQANPQNAQLTVPAGQQFGPPDKLTAMQDGDIAVLSPADAGESRVSLQPGETDSGTTQRPAEFEGTALTLAASPEGLWVTTGSGQRSVLQRLSNSLTPLPIGDVAHAVALPGGANRVWTSGRTVWVATEDSRLRLVCFVFSSVNHEPSATLALPKEDSVEATNPVVTGDLTIAPGEQSIYVAGPFGITSYRVPPVCQSAA